MPEVWAAGDAYERYVGRWSRRTSEIFVPWLEAPSGERWLDVGCGTGALAAAVLSVADPVGIVGIDMSERFLVTARTQVIDPRVRFLAGDAQALPLTDGCVDRVVSALALNFVPDTGRAVGELARVAAIGGSVAAYVWDYAGGMEMMRHFWDAAEAVDPAAADLDEGRRFPLCRPDSLRDAWSAAGLSDVMVRAIEVPTVFVDFDDFWQPFLGGQGPAPGYAMSLSDEHRDAVRDLLRARLPGRPDGSIPLTARAWAVKGTRRAAPAGT